jgi:DUF4097 and DUF4098 domain-containing protein YvlB
MRERGGDSRGSHSDAKGVILVGSSKMEKSVKRTVIFALAILASGFAAFASGGKEDVGFSSYGIDRVEIDSEFLNLELRGEDRSSVSMSTDLSRGGFFDSRGFTVRHEVEGTHLRIWVQRDGGFISSGSGTIMIQVPRGTVMLAESASGNIWIDGLSAPELHVKSASGNIQLKDVRAALDAASASGRLVVRRIHGKADLATVSGRIEMADVSGPISAKTVSGSIEGEHVFLEGDSRFKSVSGDICIDLENPLEALRYKLSTTSGVLRVGSVQASGELEAGSGKMTLEGETVSGSQFYR